MLRKVETYWPSTGKILLLGAGGITGRYYVQLLLSNGYEVFAYDEKFHPERISSDQKTWQEQIQKKYNNIHFIFDLKNKPEVDGVTLSPGFPLSNEIIQHYQKNNCPVFSELEYTLAQLPNPLVAITGTDGKSTVTALTAHLINHANVGLKAIACGNYGIPLSQLLVERIDRDTVLVCEMSSYMLEKSRNLRPKIAVFLNASADHLNRYSSFQEYVETKRNVLGQSPKNTILITQETLWEDWPNRPSVEKLILVQKKDNTIHSDSFSIAYEENQRCLFFQDKKMVSIKDLPLQGSHNEENILFALEASSHLIGSLGGNIHVPPRQNAKSRQSRFLLSSRTKLKIWCGMAVHPCTARVGGVSANPMGMFSPVFVQALKSFSPLPHRYEVFVQGEDFTAINDSKATTTQAVLAALKSTPLPVVLFLGGRSKGEDYSLLKEKLTDLTKHGSVILAFGESAGEFQKALGSLIHKTFPTFLEALQYAANHFFGNNRSYTWLLSPAATAWDEFSNFAERGDFFKKFVTEMLHQSNFIDKV
ncbi:MAG: UDP-N-acetylmuramoyl-L-alanine--D-glutamate ligase [Candidatus Hydrogenedentota bacterium]|nr:MAG: UDP-N-acetylmuramoyl-L-alanine--D-glutamate ligase [Candidatus Hydrogenedentota bacterium]